MDILPISLSQYQKTELFDNTSDLIKNNKLKEIDPTDDSQTIIENLGYFHSIQLSDIYNVTRNFLYEEIKSTKIFIYDLVDIKNNTLVSGIYFFDNLFKNSFKEALNNVCWLKLEQKLRESFELNLEKLFTSSINNQQMSISGIINSLISAKSIQRIVLALMITFDNKNKNNKRILKMGYKPIRSDINEDEYIDDDKIYDDHTINELEKSIRSIKPEFIYEHFRILLQEYRYTIYSYFTLTENKTNIVNMPNMLQTLINRYTDKFPSNIVKLISFKNIYNFSKSLSRIQKNNEYPAFPKNWKSLETDEKEEILSRLNQKKSLTSWFNISRYIRYIYSELNQPTDKSVIEDYHLELFDMIKNNIFTHMIFISMIVKGILIKFIPNKLYTDTQITPRNRNITKKLDQSLFNPNTENPLIKHSFSYLSERPYSSFGEIIKGNSNGWFTLYAMDWVSQLGFCHKFIHQRVQYITGGTGVGKSTQVPKLFMYYLKAINYNSSGKVVCTQPRKAPTSKNADTVSKELGFPINDISVNTFSNYYYVQMHHKESKHVNDTPHLFLKYITDGTLVQEIKELTPLFKRIKPDGDSEEKNLYDVIIIDEAHEHGKNMDVLLTMLRTFTYFNPEIKLIILSATMDDDEPTYRRFYRDINDNQKSPIDIKIREKQLDRINIDRRFHISPPGYGTNFPIEEIYKPGGDVYDIVKEVIRDGMKGFMLIFQPGEADIIKMVEELNRIIPDDVLAIPFYSSLPDSKKKLVEDIDDNYKNIRMNKLEDYKTVKNPFEGSSSYNNFIICATNIAEASITIKKLVYVIETGTRKSNIYDYKNRISKLKLLPISESSRLQRKGRVGRTGPGKVYYMYKKGDMESNKILFEFSTNNIVDDIFVYLTKQSQKLITQDEILKDKKISEQFAYLFSTSKGRFTYYGIDSHSDYSYKEKYYPKLYGNGYDSTSLYDYSGDFYIIHPEELDLDRSIMGRFVKTRNPLIEIKDGVIKSEKIQSFFDDLLLSKFIELSNDNYYSTNYGEFFYKIINKFQFDNQNLNKLLANALLLDNIDNGSMIVAMINAIAGSGSFDFTNILYPQIKIIPPENYQLKMFDLEYFKKLFPNSNSDVDTILMYCKEIISYLDKKIGMNDFREVDKIIINNKNISENEYRDIIDNFNEHPSPDVEDREQIIQQRVTLKFSHPDIKQYSRQFASIIKVDYEHILDFVQNYIMIKDIATSVLYPDKRGKNLESEIKFYRSEFKKYKDFNPNYVQFLITQPFNVAKHIQTTSRFMNIYMPASENIFSISTYRQELNNKSIVKESLGFDFYKATNYVLYFNVDIMKDTISIVVPIDKSYLKLFDNIYNRKRLNKYEDKFKKIDKYIKKLEDPKVPERVVNDDIGALIKVKTTYDQLMMDLS
jgi:HrpA-like RNA helicase